MLQNSNNGNNNDNNNNYDDDNNNYNNNNNNNNESFCDRISGSSCYCYHRYRHCHSSSPNSSVGSVADLRTEGRWFDPQPGQYSFRGLMIVIARKDSFLSHRCPLFRQWLCEKAASGLKRIMCGVLVKRTPGKHG